MVIREEIRKKEAQRWTGSFFPTALSLGGSIALSRRSDLGLTSALERLALVSSASFTISRKPYPTLASSSSTQTHRGHVTQLLFAALKNPLKLLSWKIVSLSCDGFLLKDDMSGRGFKKGQGEG